MICCGALCGVHDTLVNLKNRKCSGICNEGKRRGKKKKYCKIVFSRVGKFGKGMVYKAKNHS